MFDSLKGFKLHNTRIHNQDDRLDINVKGSKVKKSQEKPPKKVNCKYCDFLFQTPSDVTHFKNCKERLQLIENEERSKFECPCCKDPKKIFKTTQNVEKHIISKHTSKQYECAICHKTFAATYTLKDHKEAIHEGKKRYKCSQCESKFATKQGRKVHEQSHTQEPENICTTCRARYSQSTSLSKHICRLKQP